MWNTDDINIRNQVVLAPMASWYLKGNGKVRN